MRFRIGGIAIAAACCSACASSMFLSTWTVPDAEPLQIRGAKVGAAAKVAKELERQGIIVQRD